MNKHITLYTSDYCGHARAVEHFMAEYDIPVEVINISHNWEARQRVVAINNGYASVPTLIFPDGSHLTEPSIRQLRTRLGLDAAEDANELRDYYGRDTG